MAGGKESPRQKMIGMMYLVLTALLALQVSNAVLEKFVFIDEALRKQGEEMAEKNAKYLASINAKVADKGNRADDVKALNKAKEVREMTTELMKYLNETRATMAIITGAGDDDGYDENGNLIGAKDYDIVGNYMIKKDNGEVLKKRLNDYAKRLEELTGDKFEPLAKDAKDIDIAKNDENQKMKNFQEYYFGNTPTAAGMATISHLETEVLNYESRALGDIAEQVGAKDVEFDIIVPLIRPQSNVVAAGAKFEAELFVTAASSGTNPTFMMNGKEVESGVMESGVKYGKIAFTATAGSYDPKTLTAEKGFEAEIELNDSIYKISHKYFVVKPVIQVRSAALQALYMNCGNELDIQVPALGTSYNPVFSAAGTADVVRGNRTGLVTVIPKGRSKVKLTVSNDGSSLGTETFDVKKVPPPSIEITSRGKPVDLEKGINAAALTTLKVSAEPDENFAREVPNDARYRVRKISVKLARAGRQVQAQEFTSENIDLRSWRSLFRKGDNLVIKVENVSRRTYQGENERAKPLTEIYSIPID